MTDGERDQAILNLVRLYLGVVARLNESEVQIAALRAVAEGGSGLRAAQLEELVADYREKGEKARSQSDEEAEDQSLRQWLLSLDLPKT